jgi:hypothetical protein
MTPMFNIDDDPCFNSVYAASVVLGWWFVPFMMVVFHDGPRGCLYELSNGFLLIKWLVIFFLLNDFSKSCGDDLSKGLVLSELW